MSELDAQGLWIHRKHEALAGVLAPKSEVAVSHAREQTAKTVGILATEMAGNDYLGGSEFTAADILFVHCLLWAERELTFSNAAVPAPSNYLPIWSKPSYRKDTVSRI